METETLQNASSILAGVIFFVGLMRYALMVIRGKTRPTLSSWFIWLLLDITTVAGMISEGVYEGQAIAAAIGSTIVVIAALAFGSERGQWRTLDYVCVISGITGIVLWRTLSDATWCIIASQLGGVFVGSIPTMRNAWTRPEDEDKTAWTLYFVSCWFALLAIKKLTFADVLQPVNFTVIETFMIYVLFLHKPKRTGS